MSVRPSLGDGPGVSAGAAGTTGVRHLRSLIALLAILVAAPAFAEGEEDALASASATDLSEATSSALQDLFSHWDELSDAQRRALLTEFHRRMVAAGRKPVLRIRGERRFGYRVPGPNGQVVEIQRRQGFVRYRELDPNRPFGVGFEERVGGDPQPVAVVGAEAPRPGSEAAAVPTDEASVVPPVPSEPVYQLPVRRVRAVETPR